MCLCIVCDYFRTTIAVAWCWWGNGDGLATCFSLSIRVAQACLYMVVARVFEISWIIPDIVPLVKEGHMAKPRICLEGPTQRCGCGSGDFCGRSCKQSTINIIPPSWLAASPPSTQCPNITFFVSLPLRNSSSLFPMPLFLLNFPCNIYHFLTLLILLIICLLLLEYKLHEGKDFCLFCPCFYLKVLECCLEPSRKLKKNVFDWMSEWSDAI